MLDLVALPLCPMRPTPTDNARCSPGGGTHRFCKRPAPCRRRTPARRCTVQDSSRRKRRDEAAAAATTTISWDRGGFAACGSVRNDAVVTIIVVFVSPPTSVPSPRLGILSWRPRRRDRGQRSRVAAPLSERGLEAVAGPLARSTVTSGGPRHVKRSLLPRIVAATATTTTARPCSTTASAPGRRRCSSRRSVPQPVSNPAADGC